MTYNAPVNGMIWYQTVTEWCFVFDSVSQSVAQQVTGSKVEDLRYINGPFRDRIVRGQSDGSNAIRKEANFCYLAFYEAAKWGVYRNATIDSTLGNGIDYTPGIGAMDGYHNEVTQKVLLADRHVSDDGSYQLPNRDWDSVPKSNITAVYPQGAPLITGGWTYTSMVGRRQRLGRLGIQLDVLRISRRRHPRHDGAKNPARGEIDMPSAKSPRARRFQFGLRALLVAQLLVAVSFGCWAWWRAGEPLRRLQVAD